MEAVELAANAHGLTAKHVDGWIELDGGALRIQPQVRPHSRTEDQVTVQLNIVVEARALGDLPLVDSFAGIGSNEEAAERDAFGKFLLGSFHVIIEALTVHVCDSDQIDWLRVAAPDRAWRVCSGVLLTQSNGPHTASPQYQAFFEKLQELLLSAEAGKPHWASVFFASFHGALKAVQVMLDGAPWEPATELLHTVAWDAPESYQSLRHLFIALPESK